MNIPPSDKENQRNRQFEGKRVVDARKAGPGGEPREERNNQRNTEVDFHCNDYFPVADAVIDLSNSTYL